MSLGIPDRTLIWGTAATQFIGWGTLYFNFPLLVGPMAEELGWSRVLINGAFTAGLLVAGLLAVPVGRWLDARGARAMMSLGALGGAALLLAADILVRVVAPERDIKLGVLTAIVGAPFFFWLVWSERRREA